MATKKKPAADAVKVGDVLTLEPDPSGILLAPDGTVTTVPVGGASIPVHQAGTWTHGEHTYTVVDPAAKDGQ